MYDFLFYLFSALILFSAVGVVINRNPVNSAMLMILSLVSLAGMFVLLNAFFLAILQILVYAGAVMVLFVFIIMLLNVETESKRKCNMALVVTGLVVGVVLCAGIFDVVNDREALPALEMQMVNEMPEADAPMSFTTSAKSFGYSMFTKYMLPFQVTGFLLLIAMIGVIVISKDYRDDSVDEEEGEV